MALNDFTDFLLGANFALWEAAIADILQTVDDQREAARRSIYLSTALLSELQDRYGALVGAQPDATWDAEVFREHLQEVIQAYFLMGSTEAGVKQVVGATTQIPPLLRPINLLQRWLLGFQYLPNRFYLDLDGFVAAEVDEPYTITDENNLLVLRINGVEQSFVLPTGDAMMAKDVIDSINATIIGALAFPYGKRFALETIEADVGGSIKVKAESTADTLFGLDNAERDNAPVPGGTGILPLGWRLTGSYLPQTLATGTITSTGAAVVGVSTLFTTELMVGDSITAGGQVRKVTVITDNTHLTVGVAFSPNVSGVPYHILEHSPFLGIHSEPASFDGAVFGIGTAEVVGTRPSPFVGLLTGNLLLNGGFEDGFTEWDRTEGPNFFLSLFKRRSGIQSLAVVTKTKTIVGPDGTRTVVPVRNTITTDRKPLPGGRLVLVEGYHQAHIPGALYASPPAPSSVYEWTVSNAVLGYTDQQFSRTPIVNDPDAFTVKLRDPDVNFVTLGVKVGMAVHVVSGSYAFDAIVRGVQIHEVLLDQWRNGPTGGPTAYINGSSAAYGATTLQDTGKNFITLGVQTGSDFRTRDKVRVDETIRHFDQITTERQIVRDIEAVSASPSHLLYPVGGWGASPTPQTDNPYTVYIRPPDGTAYTIYHALNEIPDFAPAVECISADFEYDIRFYGVDGLIQTTRFPVRPTASEDYARFAFTAAAPGGTEAVQLAITVAPDDSSGVPLGDAVVSIDDVQFKVLGGDLNSELHVAVDGVMQKVVFEDTAKAASGTVTYTDIPADGDTITVDDVVYEFNSDPTTGRDIGSFVYTGLPVDGDTVIFASPSIEERYEFDDNCSFAPGNHQVILDASDITGDSTFTNLVTAINLTSNLVTATIDTATNTVTIASRETGAHSPAIVFDSRGLSHTSLVGSFNSSFPRTSNWASSMVVYPSDNAVTNPAKVATVIDQRFQPNATVAPLTNVSVGRLLVISVTFFADSTIGITGITDTKGNTYQLDAVSAGPLVGLRKVRTYIFSSVITGALVSPSDAIFIVGLPNGLERSTYAASYSNATNVASVGNGNHSPVSSTAEGFVPFVNHTPTAVAYGHKVRVVAVGALHFTGPAHLQHDFTLRGPDDALVNSPAYTADVYDSSTPTADTDAIPLWVYHRVENAADGSGVTNYTTPGTLTGGTSNVILGQTDLEDTYTRFVDAVIARSTKVMVKQVSPVITVEAIETGAAGNDISFSTPGSAAYTLIPTSGHLQGGGEAHAEGYLHYTGQPNDGDTITVGSFVFEFDSNNATTPGNVVMTIRATADATYAEAAQTITLQDEVTATQDAVANRVNLQANVVGIAGNSIVLLESAVNVTATPGNPPGTLLGGLAPDFTDLDSPTCAAVAAYINGLDESGNPRVYGLTASCDGDGHLVLTSNTSGLKSCMVVGYGSANGVLGLTPGVGRCNSEKAVHTGWRLGTAGTLTITESGTGAGTVTSDV